MQGNIFDVFYRKFLVGLGENVIGTFSASFIARS